MAYSHTLVWGSPRSEMDQHRFITTPELSQAPPTAFGASGGIAEALRSVARADTWSSQRVLLQTASLFTVQDQKPILTHPESPVLGCGRDDDKRCMAESQDKVQEEAFEVKLKYISGSVPLYQEYWLKCMKAELQKAQHKKLADIVEVRCRSAVPSAAAPSPLGASSPPALHVAPYALWQQLPEVKRQNLLHTLTARDISHQEAMFELIVSEASYQKSLRVAVGLFQSSTELKQTLTPVQNHVLFSNLKEVCRISEGFLQDLETRLGQNVVMSKVGDIILNHKSTFRRVYVPYVTNMMYQETLITKLLQENRKFVLALKKLEKDQLCQRQTLKSFLILPFQRITRLRLILENILKRTTEHSTDVPNLRGAIEVVREIVVECDRNVQQMKQTEELVSLEKLMDFANVKSVPLIVSGRHLIREGPLKKLTVKSYQTSGSMVSRTDIYLHLFNDLLLLSLRKALYCIPTLPRYNTTDDLKHIKRARSSTNTLVTNPTCDVESIPEELKTKMLGLPPDAFLLRLAQNHVRAATAVILTAQTRMEKEAWLQLLSSQNGTIGNTEIKNI